MNEKSSKRRKRGRVDQTGQAKVSVYLYPDELASVTKAAESLGVSVSGYIALAAKARAASDLQFK